MEEKCKRSCKDKHSGSNHPGFEPECLWEEVGRDVAGVVGIILHCDLIFRGVVIRIDVALADAGLLFFEGDTGGSEPRLDVNEG